MLPVTYKNYYTVNTQCVPYYYIYVFIYVSLSFNLTTLKVLYIKTIHGDCTRQRYMELYSVIYQPRVAISA